MNVPTVGGYYTAHIDPDTEAQLFGDADFKQALQGRVDSPIYRDLSHRPLRRHRLGPQHRGPDPARRLLRQRDRAPADRPRRLALVAAPFEGMGDLLARLRRRGRPGHPMINAAPGVDVALIVRPPQDRLQQNISTSWSWVGDYGVPSDSTTGDAALYKRAVVLEHA
jgi:hypothetical protein